MQINKPIGFLLALLVALPMAYAADDNLSGHPGFVDFSTLTAIAGNEPNVEVSLREPLLDMITNILRNSDEDSAEFVSKLLQVNVKVYENPSLDTALLAMSMSEIAESLESRSWERVVRVRDSSEHVDVYFRLSDSAEIIHGIAIMVAEPGETVLVNIVGDISAADIGALAARFEIDELENLDFDVDPDDRQDD
ncbi:MAG: hypothetical protein RLZZ385_2216 [Pseudomonadota bacterium]|jgi:hypothetical protein